MKDQREQLSAISRNFVTHLPSRKCQASAGAIHRAGGVPGIRPPNPRAPKLVTERSQSLCLQERRRYSPHSHSGNPWKITGKSLGNVARASTGTPCRRVDFARSWPANAVCVSLPHLMARPGTVNQKQTRRLGDTVPQGGILSILGLPAFRYRLSGQGGRWDSRIPPNFFRSTQHPGTGGSGPRAGDSL